MAVPGAVAVACAAAVFVSTIINKQAIYLWFSILLFFFATATVMRPRPIIPQGERIEMVAQIDDLPTIRGRWQSTSAHVGHFRINSEWHRADENIRLHVDTCYRIEEGQQIGFRGWVNPIDSGSYGRLMALRGLHSQVYLTPGNLLRTAPHTSYTPSWWATKLHSKAVERLDLLRLEPSSRGVVMAMAAGDRAAIEREVRNDYAATGAAHLLAVSGLHVGIVFVLINIILYLLPAVRYGNIYRNIVAILAIWTYAVAAGLAPSVIRAALMFSFAQLALASGSWRNGFNIMLGSAVVMLALNPNFWGDPSFMLSYAAVLSITAFFGPVYNLVKTRRKVVNVVLSVVIVGMVASAGTAPLVAYWFGNVPLAGMAINPIVMVTAHIIVMLGVVWMVVPVECLNGVFSTVLDLAAGVQNDVVRWSAGRSWAAIPVHDMPLWAVVVLYVLLGIVAILLWNRRKDDARGY